MSNQDLMIQTPPMAAPSTVQGSNNQNSSSNIGAALLALREIAGDDAEFMATSRKLAADTRRSSLDMRLKAAKANYASRMAEAIGSIASGVVQLAGTAVAMNSMYKAANPADRPPRTENPQDPPGELEMEEVEDVRNGGDEVQDEPVDGANNRENVGPVREEEAVEAEAIELEEDAAPDDALNNQEAGEVVGERAEVLLTQNQHFKLEMSRAENWNNIGRGVGVSLDGLGKVISAQASTEAEKKRAAADRVDGTGRMLQDLANQFGQTISGALSAYQNATETFKRSAGG